MNTGADRFSAWEQWRRACALDLTPEEPRRELIWFLAQRFFSGVRRAAPGVSPGRIPEDEVCAGLFESWCALNPRGDGKAYKQWLFARGEGLGAVESGVSLLMRKVVREWLHLERPVSVESSLNAPLGAGGLTLEDLLPDPADDFLLLDEAGWRARRLPDFRSRLSRSQRVALAARARGLPFTHPAVSEAAGVKHAQLSKQYNRLVLELGEAIREDFPAIPASTALELFRRCLDELAACEKMKISVEQSRLARCMEEKETP